METIAFSHMSWSAVRDLGQWPALVGLGFHPGCLGIGEGYQGITDAEGKVAAMRRYGGDLLACTARAGEDLVGLLIRKTDGGRLVVYDLFVADAFRRRGIGRELVALAMRASHASVAAAEINRENAPSRALFESCGFRRTLSSDWFVLPPPAAGPSGPAGLERVTLEGRLVRLDPLQRDHHAALCAVGLDPDLWRWTAGHVDDAEGMRAYIERALARQAEGSVLPFATVERTSGTVVGSTRFACFEPEDRHVEIGWTWIAPRWQRTGINVEAKYLMLRHAFESLRLNRVELKTDVLNAASRRAILGIGATEEGTLRRHMVTSRGRVRDTVLFSIVADEWPSVRARLESRLAGGTAPSGGCPPRRRQRRP